jgi:chromosome partitioning protein
MNLKGGVAKTTTSVNMAHILVQEYGKRVLVVDNDKQGNCSKFFKVHGYDRAGMAEVMTDRNVYLKEVIQHTEYENLDVIAANMNLLRANMEVMMDQRRPQQTRLKKALQQVEQEYDYCVIDNAPDINIATVNALVASDDVMIPITIDDFALDGLEELAEQIENTREELNPDLRLCGCFVTQFDRTNEADQQVEEYLRNGKRYPVFRTHIRRTGKVKQSTFAREPITLFSKRCGASMDYKALVDEYLKM